jgi:hypothetical protein
MRLASSLDLLLSIEILFKGMQFPMVSVLFPMNGSIILGVNFIDKKPATSDSNLKISSISFSDLW